MLSYLYLISLVFFCKRIEQVLQHEVSFKLSMKALFVSLFLRLVLFDHLTVDARPVDVVSMRKSSRHFMAQAGLSMTEVDVFSVTTDGVQRNYLHWRTNTPALTDICYDRRTDCEGYSSKRTTHLWEIDSSRLLTHSNYISCYSRLARDFSNILSSDVWIPKNIGEFRMTRVAAKRKRQPGKFKVVCKSNVNALITFCFDDGKGERCWNPKYGYKVIFHAKSRDVNMVTRFYCDARVGDFSVRGVGEIFP